MLLVNLLSGQSKAQTPQWSDLAANPGSEHYEVVSLGNGIETVLLYDNKNHQIVLISGASNKSQNEYHLVKVDVTGEVIDTFSGTFDRLINPLLPILTRKNENVYFDWINSGNKNPKSYTVTRVSEAMSFKQWQQIFVNLYNRAEAVYYDGNDNKRIFKIGGHWEELEQNDAVDRSDLYIKVNYDNSAPSTPRANVAGYPSKCDTQLVALQPINKCGLSFSWRKGIGNLRLVKFKKDYCIKGDNPVIPLFSFLHNEYVGTGYFTLSRQRDRVYFTAPVVYTPYRKQKYDAHVYLYYLPRENSETNTVVFLERFENTDLKSGRKSSVYMVKKRR